MGAHEHGISVRDLTYAMPPLALRFFDVGYRLFDAPPKRAVFVQLAVEYGVATCCFDDWAKDKEWSDA